MGRYQTDVTMLLDRSGSMGSMIEETITGFNEFIGRHRALPGETCLTLVQFDEQYEVVYDAVPLAEVPQLTYKLFQPRGATALLDALGMSVRQASSRILAEPEQDRPSQVVFVILTDGVENASSKFDRKLVFDMIQHQRDTNDWQFVFLGANQDAIAEAGELGIPKGAARQFDASSRGTLAAFRAISRGLESMRLSNSDASHFFDSSLEDGSSSNEQTWDSGTMKDKRG